MLISRKSVLQIVRNQRIDTLILEGGDICEKDFCKWGLGRVGRPFFPHIFTCQSYECTRESNKACIRAKLSGNIISAIPESVVHLTIKLSESNDLLTDNLKECYFTLANDAMKKIGLKRLLMKSDQTIIFDEIDPIFSFLRTFYTAWRILNLFCTVFYFSFVLYHLQSELFCACNPSLILIIRFVN